METNLIQSHNDNNVVQQRLTKFKRRRVVSVPEHLAAQVLVYGADQRKCEPENCDFS